MAKRRTVSERWLELRNEVRARWDRLTDADIDLVQGNAERLIALLQARYGYARRTAIREITLWSRSLTKAS